MNKNKYFSIIKEANIFKNIFCSDEGKVIERTYKCIQRAGTWLKEFSDRTKEQKERFIIATFTKSNYLLIMLPL